MKRSKGAQEAKVRKIPQHDCALPLEDETSHYRIYEGCFVQFRRKWWKWITISPSDPHSKKYLKSATKIHAEELRHLIHFPNVIHPFSVGRFTWEMIMLPVLLILYILIPVIISIPFTQGYMVLYLKMALDVMCWIDMVMWFMTGYYDQARQVVVLNFSYIAKQYVFTYFIFDLASSLPLKMYLHLIGKEFEYHYLMAFLLFKGVRLPTLVQYMKKFSLRTGILESNIKFVCFTTVTVILLMWTTSIIYLVVRILHPAAVLRRIGSYSGSYNFPVLVTGFLTTRFLMTVGVTYIVNASSMFMLLEIVLITIGAVLGVIILAKVMAVYQKVSSSRNKYNNLLEQIGEYMSYKELPLRLKGKIMKYVDFKFQKHIFREEDVLSNLSSVLKHDILLQRCQRMVQKVDFFKDLPPEAMLRIVTKLRSEIYLSNDVIVLAGYAGNSMYFIYLGTVAVYTPTGKEICHLEDGDHFGEIALIINEPRVATVVAVKECELFKLSRRDFQEAVEPFPQLNKKIREKAMSRLEKTLQMLYDEGLEQKEGDEGSESEKSDVIDVDATDLDILT